MKQATFILIFSLILTGYSVKASDKTLNDELSGLENFMNSQEQLIKYSAPDFIETSEFYYEDLNNFMEITEEFLKYDATNFEDKLEVSVIENLEALIDMSLKYKAPSEDYSEITENEFDSLADYINYTITSLKYNAPVSNFNNANFSECNFNNLACIM